MQLLIKLLTILLTCATYNTNTYTTYITYNTIRLLTLRTILMLTLLTILTKIIRSLTLLTNLAQRKSNFFSFSFFYSTNILLAFTLTDFLRKHSYSGTRWLHNDCITVIITFAEAIHTHAHTHTHIDIHTVQILDYSKTAHVSLN